MRFPSFAVLAVLFVALPPSGASAGNWDWQLPAGRYKKLDPFERAQYDKAAGLLTAGNPVAAAGEFEKFKVQFPDSPALPYALFMRGYALQQAKQRNTAVKVYQEVLDYFPDQIDDAAPALYFMGVAHLDNGEVRKGLVCMKKLADDRRYQAHPLAAGALRRLADNYWGNQSPDEAVRYWRQAIQQFGRANDEERAFAANNLACYAILTRDYAGYENFFLASYFTDAERDAPAARRWLAENLWQCASNLYNSPGFFDRKHKPSEREQAEEAKALYDYLKGTKPAYEKAGDLWSYYEHAVSCLIHYHKDKAERDRQLDEAVAFLKEPADKAAGPTAAEKAAADDHLARLVDLCREGSAFERARHLIAQMTDRVRAAYKEYETLYSEQKWEAAARQLEAVEAAGQPAWADRALGERARMYREILNRQPEAIALYQRLNTPPATLWGIQECYKRMGKLEAALTTLSEIENSFPADAARAAWHKASYLNEAGDKRRAIAAARHVATAYKTAPEAGAAHTLLEAYGVHLVGGESEGREK